MKVLFIYPNLDAQVGFNYGVAFLSACLKERGHTTALLDINENLGFDLDLARIKEEIAAFTPDLIGFSVVTNQYRFARSSRSNRCPAEERIVEMDKGVSRVLDLSGETHYGYKDNLFTAVRSH